MRTVNLLFGQFFLDIFTCRSRASLCRRFLTASGPRSRPRSPRSKDSPRNDGGQCLPSQASPAPDWNSDTAGGFQKTS